MRAGSLQHRVVVEVKSTSLNTYGENVGTWSTYLTLWADVQPIAGREYIAAGANIAEEQTRIVVRYNSTITAQMRILFRSVYYNIERLSNIGARDRMLELICTRGKADG